MSFDTLGLSEKVLSAVADAGYTEPTPIQAAAIPYVLERRDVLGIAQTGTGKTASFVLPMLTLLEKGRARARMPRTLILEPTRELAAQVEENFNKYGKNYRLNVALLIGGMSFDEQDRKLDRGVDVLIATPGRLLDHFERGKLLLQGVEIFVIDEADRMLDMGFIPDIERIAKLIPFTRQTLFFSATMPPEIQRLTDTFLQNPQKVEVSRPASAATTVTQRLVGCGPEEWNKREVLRGLIREAQDLKNAIIFCNRKRDVATLARSLEKHGFSVGALHGDMDQHARMITLDSFRKGNLALLVASDVAARGLDIPDVSHVFNFDVPHHAEDYVHRIGRTGRAGRSGTAYTLVTASDAKSLGAIEKLIGGPIEWQGEPPDPNARPERPERSERRGGRGERSEGRGRRGGRERTPRGERPAAAAEAAPAPEAAEPVAEVAAADVPSGPVTPGGDRMRSTRRGEGRRLQSPAPAGEPRPRERRRRHEDDDAPVIGLGDHVPAFLLRPVRLPKSSRTSADESGNDA